MTEPVARGEDETESGALEVEASKDTELLKRASKEFAAYCESEIHHRRNSGQDFDEELFNDAVDMTVRRLRALESGGLA